MLIGMPDVTTIKVPRALRDRIAHDAAGRGITAAALLRDLLDRYERDERLAAVGRAYATESDHPSGDADDVQSWDATLADGLDE